MPTTKETEELNQTRAVNELEEGVENIVSMDEKKKQEEENLNGVKNAEFVRYLEINHPKENSFLDNLEKKEEFRKEFEEKRENLRSTQQCLDFFYPLEKRKKIIKLDIDD